MKCHQNVSQLPVQHVTCCQTNHSHATDCRSCCVTTQPICSSCTTQRSATAYYERTCNPSFCDVHILNENVFVFHKMLDSMWDTYTRNSKGWAHDPIAVVYPRIYLGSAADITPPKLHKYNITHIINCATEEFTVPWFKFTHPDNYETIGAEDSLDFDITAVYPKFEKAMNTFLANPSSGSIFVHCQCGINRSAFLVLLYMVRKFGFDIQTVVKHILIQRPCCFRNPSFRKQVTEYIKKLD